MDKIYIVTESEINDFAFYEHTPKAFVDEDSAKEYYKERVDFHKCYADEDWVVDESDTAFETYPDGRGAEDCIYVTLHEVEM
jgi:hypothetical protein